MNMTESEIAVSYRQARKPEGQIVILSQLNDCESGDIVDILLRQGFSLEELPKKYRPRKIICKQCGVSFDSNTNKKLCPVCIEKRKKGWQQRAKEKRAAEYAANPKRCADCGAVLKNRLATYCKSCAAARQKESMRRSKQRRYQKEKREAEYAANPKKCADCGVVLENRRFTYCETCAAARKRESARRSNRKRYYERKEGSQNDKRRPKRRP